MLQTSSNIHLLSQSELARLKLTVFQKEDDTEKQLQEVTHAIMTNCYRDLHSRQSQMNVYKIGEILLMHYAQEN